MFLVNRMADFPTLLMGGYSKLKTHTNMSHLFCSFVDDLSRVSTQQVPVVSVDHLFIDMNKQIDKYNEQFQVILDELGILCKDTSTSKGVEQFFEALLDLFRLAFSMYEKDPEKLSQFQPLLQDLVHRMDGETKHPAHDPLQNALLQQLTKSAWSLSKSRESMEDTAAALKRQPQKISRHIHTRTRKQKRT